MRSKFLRRLIAGLLSVSMIATAASPALAWKPKTHVHLAELAMRDAVDDGRVTIYQTEYASGRVTGVLGHFEANPEIVAALRARPAQYLAGVVGPDAYPDIMTGQQVIHPGTNLSLPGDPSRSERSSAGGTDAWLTHLWRLAYGGQDPNAATPEVRSFVAGYLTHAAGDMFMHTFVNHYTGGDFALQPDPKNALKHLVLEGYIGRRTPETRSQTSIEGVEGFIYNHMIRAEPGSLLEQRLLQGAGKSTSIPSIFSELRNGLQRDVNRYNRERLQRRGPARLAYAATHGPAAEYKEAWIEDIDRGLQAWPRVSHELSLALVYNPDSDGADIARAREIASAYVGDHLLSMAGAPDAVIATAQFISSVIDAILPDIMLAPLEALKKELLNWLVKEATGMSVDELKDYLNNPELRFDPVMNAPGGGYNGRQETLTSLAAFNREVLGIDDPGARYMDRKFDPERFAPSFNSIQMTKLLFLSEAGMAELLAALRAKGVDAPQLPAGVPFENTMLGFLTSMDGDNRWQGLARGSTQAEGRAFFLASGGAEAWRNLFMRQIGERPDWPQATAPAEDPSAAPDDAGFEPIDWWAVRVDDVKYDDDAGRNVAVTLTFRNDRSEPGAFTANMLDFEAVRPLLNLREGGSRVAAVRTEYLHRDEAGLPEWHFLPEGPIPPRGRVSVRYVFDVGNSVRQRLVHSVTVIEQKPNASGRDRDGASKDVPLPALNLDGSVGEQQKPAGPDVVTDAARLTALEGRYRTNRETVIDLKVVDGELVGEAMTVSSPSPRELVRLKLYADGTLRGSMREPTGGGSHHWFDLVLIFSPDGQNFAGQGTWAHSSSNPPISYTGRRVTGASGAGGGGGASAPFEPTPPVRVGSYDVSLVALTRGQENDWETTWSLTNRSEGVATVTLNHLVATLIDGSGEAAEGTGPYHYAGETDQRVRPSGFTIEPGAETKVRLTHYRSRNMEPTRFRIRAGEAETAGSLPAPR